MSTAHDHYREAERMLEGANDAEGGSDLERYHLTAAQVHATLALAATNGADKPPAARLDVRTLSDPPAQGEPIDDQMGGIPTCADPRCFQHAGHDGMPHVDSNGREYW